MHFPFIKSHATEPPTVPVELPGLQGEGKGQAITKKDPTTDPAGYLASDPLMDAVNVALLLGQPLLVTGEPGTGKTQLAYRVAWQLGWGDPLRFDTKSTSMAKDLFYTYDSLGRFHAANTKTGSQENLDYLTYMALGWAILFANDPAEVQGHLPKKYTHPGKCRRVVLIDEVDKAPRDFPNDLLNELETMSFTVPELKKDDEVVTITAERSHRPVLIVTSNSEKSLPDAFLRRCVYYHIPPLEDSKQLGEILKRRIPNIDDESLANPLLQSAVKFFLDIRNEQWHKLPSTAELLNWIRALEQWGANRSQTLAQCPDALRKSLNTLAKTRDDLDTLTTFVDTHYPSSAI